MAKVTVKSCKRTFRQVVHTYSITRVANSHASTESSAVGFMGFRDRGTQAWPKARRGGFSAYRIEHDVGRVVSTEPDELRTKSPM